MSAVPSVPGDATADSVVAHFDDLSARIHDGRIGRDGELSVQLTRRGAATVVTACRSILPLQLLAPLALGDPAAVLSVMNPTGGILGGDRLRIDVGAGASAHACLTTPSASKVYRARGAPATQEVSLRLERDAIVEWVPDHTIPFAGSAFRQTIQADVAPGATLVLVDAFAAGRVARGEAWRFRLLESALSIRDDCGWLLHDRFVLREGSRTPWSAVGLADGHPYFASVVVIADTGIPSLIESVKAIATEATDAQIGAASLPRRGAIVRCLATSAPALTDAVDRLWMVARREVVHAPPLSLRKP